MIKNNSSILTEKNLNSPHVLCVNPWIHDFAAFDFWAKPLGLLGLASIMRENGLRVSFLDCVNRFHPNAGSKIKVLPDGRGPFRKKTIPPPKGLEDTKRLFSRYGIEPEWFIQDLKKIEKFDRPDLIFVTSFMTYWASGVKETISVLKKIFPDVPVILGGIYATLCTDHAVRESMADEVIPGHGENALNKIIKKYTGFDLPFSFDTDAPDNLDTLPMPALDLLGHIPYAPILTSRGCPFSCSYCASSFLEHKLRRRSPETVFREIQHWRYNFKVKNFAFYDDALLINATEYAFPLFEKIIESDMDISFHTPNALHIREVTKDAADLMFKAGFKTIRLGLETTDFSKTRENDHKVKKNEFVNAVTQLKDAGFQSKQIGAYLLCGLPGQRAEEIKNSILVVKKIGIQPVLAYYTPIPHTPMWEKAKQVSKFDLEKNPVFTNNALFPCLDKNITLKSISQLKKLAG